MSNTLNRLLAVARIIPLDATIIAAAEQLRTRYQFQPQDAIICASVLHHLAENPGEESCFINKNRRDFDDADMVETLAASGCKILFNFANGANYVQHRLHGHDTR